MSRLFFALWPDDQTRQELEQLSQAIQAAGVKPVNPQNLHVTLVFIGGVDSALELLIKQSVADISVEPFVLTFDQLSYWSRPKVLCLTCKQPAQGDYMSGAAPGSLAAFPASIEVRSGDIPSRMRKGESHLEQQSRVPKVGVLRLAGMQEVEQCRSNCRGDAAVAECVALFAALDAAVTSCGIQTDKRPYLPHITLARHVRHRPDINFKPIVWRADSFCLVESCSEPGGVQYKVIQHWPFTKAAV